MMKVTLIHSPCKWAWLPLCIGACTEPPQEPPTVPAGHWSNQEEVLHQTRELIRYEDEQQREKLERLEELGVAPAAPAEDKGDPQDRQH